MKNVIIWGTGNKAKELVGNLKNCNVIAYVETNPQKDSFMGVEVIPSSKILIYDFELLIISVRGAEEIESNLCKNYPEILDKCCFTCLDNLKNIVFFYYQFRLLEECVEKKYLVDNNRELIEILKYYPEVLEYGNKLDEEQFKILEYAKQKGYLQKLNYEFTEKYFLQKYDIFCTDKDIYYVIYMGKKIYFPKNWNKKQVLCYWSKYLMEADEESPLSVEFGGKGIKGTIVEIGEGLPLWAIKNVEKCQRLYIINSSKEWIEALRLTLRNYIDKCVIGNSINIIEENYINYCKIQKKEIVGLANVILKKKTVKCFLISIYYNKNDYCDVNGILENRGYRMTLSEGYVYYPSNCDYETGFDLRKGLMSAEIN